MKPLTRRFFSRPAEEVARRLIGKMLVAGQRAGMIVETEAYVGPHDLACHARFGRTKRNAVMWGPAGFSYVYLIYGMYDMFNVVTGPPDDGQAVLIRAIAPGPGLGDSHKRTSGPGKLCRALDIDRSHSGIDLTRGGELYVGSGRRIAPDQIACGPRIGIDYAGSWAHEPLRFWLDGHPAVSRRR